MSLRKTAVRTLLRSTSGLMSPDVPLAVQRALLRSAGVSMRRPKGTRTADATLAGRPVRRIDVPATDPARHLLYLHGGAYVTGGLASHTGLAAQFAHHAAACTWLLDYRLAPEHPHPAAVDDALAAYRALLAQGAQPSRVSIAGDSAGGGLTLATVLAIRDAGLPMPGAIALVSPWTDLTLSGRSMEGKLESDPMLAPPWLDWAAGQYCANTVRTHPTASPLFADFSGLPPMIVHVGSDEVLLDDALQLAPRAKSAGVACTLRVFEGLWHVFQAQAGLIPEADESLREMGAFLRERTAR